MDFNILKKSFAKKENLQRIFYFFCIFIVNNKKLKEMETKKIKLCNLNFAGGIYNTIYINGEWEGIS